MGWLPERWPSPRGATWRWPSGPRPAQLHAVHLFALRALRTLCTVCVAQVLTLSPNATHAQVVIDLYTRGFVEAFDTYLSITDNNMGIVEYQDFGWDEEDGRAFAEAIRYAEEHCTKNGRTLTFLMKGNNFGEKSSKLLKEAAADQKCISVDIET